MALESLSAVTNALGQRLSPKLYTLWNRQAVAANLIEAQAGAGPNAAWDIESANSTVPDTVAEGSDLQAAEMQSDLNDAAKLGWADYRTGFNITQRALDAAASSGGITAEQLVDLFDERAMAKAAALISKINKDIYLGNGTSTGSSQPNLVGLFGGATDATGTYAGLSRSTYADFVGSVLANGGTPRALTLALMATAEQNVFVNCGEPPTHILCSPGVFRKYETLFTNVQRLATDGRGPLTFSAGATSLFYKGIPLIRDKDCPAGKLIMINANYVKMKFLPRAGQTKDAVYSEMRTLVGKANAPDTLTATTIPYRIELLGKTGSSYKAMLYTTIQLVVTKPNAFAQVLDIDET